MAHWISRRILFVHRKIAGFPPGTNQNNYKTESSYFSKITEKLQQNAQLCPYTTIVPFPNSRRQPSRHWFQISADQRARHWADPDSNPIFLHTIGELVLFLKVFYEPLHSSLNCPIMTNDCPWQLKLFWLKTCKSYSQNDRRPTQTNWTVDTTTGAVFHATTHFFSWKGQTSVPNTKMPDFYKKQNSAQRSTGLICSKY